MRVSKTDRISHAHVERLNEVSKACRERGAKVEILNVDISSDSAEFERQLLAIDSKYPLDLLVANAGVNGRTLLGAGSISGDARAHTAVESAPEMFFVEAMKPIVQGRRIAVCIT